MPYITRNRREALDTGDDRPEDAGELNYLLTKIAIRYAQEHGHNYQTLNDITGALEGAKLEFYRRVVAPYENVKVTLNGDVY